MLISSSSRYSIYKVQSQSRSSRRLRYLSTSCRICQALFSSFFKFFFVPVALPAGAVHQTTSKWYHKQFVLSRTFFLFFEFLFDLCPPKLSLHQATRRYYHIQPFLSSPFFARCRIFCSFLFGFCRPPDSFDILPRTSSFVKHYFRLFSKNKQLFTLSQFWPIFPCRYWILWRQYGIMDLSISHRR